MAYGGLHPSDIYTLMNLILSTTLVYLIIATEYWPVQTLIEIKKKIER